jgi:hypothetical protein
LAELLCACSFGFNGGISFVLAASSSFGGLLSDDVVMRLSNCRMIQKSLQMRQETRLMTRRQTAKCPTENRWFLATQNENVGAGLDCLSSSSSSSSMVSAVGSWQVRDTVRRFAALLRLEDLLETLLQAFFSFLACFSLARKA